MTDTTAGQYEKSAAFGADLAVMTAALNIGRMSNRCDPRMVLEAVRACAVHARTNRYPPAKLVRALKALVREVALEDGSDAYRLLYTDRRTGWAIEGFL